MINMPGSDDQPGLPAGSQLDVFCETCWRIWTTSLPERYRDSADFDARNRMICPLCSGNHCRTARAADVTVKPRGGDRI
jgi:hypothetical protein